MPERDFPLTFRSEVLKPLTEKLRRGESVSLVGVASVGKGNLTRQLLRRTVRAHYFQDDAPNFALLMVDCNFLSGYDDATFYAELFAALGKHADELGARGQELQPQLAAWAREALKPEMAMYAQQNLRDALDALLANAKQRIVFLLDDCDALITNGSAALLRALRALRDAHKGQLMYVTLTRRELSKLRPPSLDFEHFFELSPAHMLGLKPYRERDAEVMLDFMASQQASGAHTLTDAEKQRLYLLSGGHAGLLKQCYEATAFGARALELNLNAELLRRRLIQNECEKIIETLEPEEVETLRNFARGERADSFVSSLMGKGLLVPEVDNSPKIFSPLFAQFLRDAASDTVRVETPPPAAPPPAPKNMTPIVFDADAQTIQIGERTIRLDQDETEVLDVLMARRPNGCEDGELIARLVMTQSSNVSYSMLYHILNGLEIKMIVHGQKYLTRDTEGRWRVRGDNEI